MLKKLRHFKYRAKYIYGKYLPLRVPVDVSLELSSFCTNTCGYCYHGDPKNLPFKRGHMSKELAFKIIRECAEYGVHSIKTNFRGESTMNPHFHDITKLAKFYSCGSTLIDRITNSNFNFKIDREDIFMGLCYQTKVKVSFDSFIKEVFEKQRRGSNYERTIANIDKFYKYPGRKNELIIQAVRTNLNKDEDLAHEIKSRWPEAGISIRDCVEGRINKDLSETVVKRRDYSDRQACNQAFARLMVHWNGKTTGCCPDIEGKLEIGDCNTQTIIEVFNSQHAKLLRKDLKSKKAFETDPCKNCSSYETFKGFKPNWNS